MDASSEAVEARDEELELSCEKADMTEHPIKNLLLAQRYKE